MPAESTTEIFQAEDEQEEPETQETAGAVVSTSTDPRSGVEDAPRGRREHIRVQADAGQAGRSITLEVSIYRSRLEQQNNTLGFNLNELEQTVDRLRAQLRSLDIETEAQILFRYEREKEERELPRLHFDPLELDRFSTIQQLSRSLLETVNDLTNINGYLEDLNKETEPCCCSRPGLRPICRMPFCTRMVPVCQQVPRLAKGCPPDRSLAGQSRPSCRQGAERENWIRYTDRMIGPLNMF